MTARLRHTGEGPVERERARARRETLASLVGPRGQRQAKGERVFTRLRQRLTYANVMSTLAAFIALGGFSYAAMGIGSQEIANNSVRGIDVRNRSLTRQDLKRNTLDGTTIRESRLAKVPRARNADRVGGLSAAELKVKCPAGDSGHRRVCAETTPRAPVAYGTAVLACADTDVPGTPGRRLPTHGELRAALGSLPLAAGGELTSHVLPSGSDPARWMCSCHRSSRARRAHPGTGAGAKAFRCVADPLI